MRISFLIAATLLSQSCFAESQARTDRGFSCTDYCTAKGSKANTLNRVNVNTYVDICSKESTKPGSIATCEANCLDKGSLSTRLFNKNRATNVQAHIKSLKDACTNLKTLQETSQKTRQPVQRPTQNTQPMQPMQQAPRQPQLSKEECRELPQMRQDYNDLMEIQEMQRDFSTAAESRSLQQQLGSLKANIDSMSRQCGQSAGPRTLGQPR